MRISALHYFLETARLGSIRKASEVLHVAPSAVSRQVALLEQDFGAPLFERFALGVRPTAAGKVFALQARAILRDLDRLRLEIDDLQQLRRGLVKVSCMEGALPGVMYRAIRDFGRTYPGITFEIAVAGSETQIIALARDEFDLSLISNPPAHPDVLVDYSFRDPICAVVYPGHTLAKRRSLQLAELTGLPLVLLDTTFVTRTLVDRAAARDGVSLAPSLTVNAMWAALSYTRQRMGLSFAPRHILGDDVAAGNLVCIPISNGILQRATTTLCRHRSRKLSKPAAAFLRVLRRHVAELNDVAGSRVPAF